MTQHYADELVSEYRVAGSALRDPLALAASRVAISVGWCPGQPIVLDATEVASKHVTHFCDRQSGGHRIRPVDSLSLEPSRICAALLVEGSSYAAVLTEATEDQALLLAETIASAENLSVTLLTTSVSGSDVLVVGKSITGDAGMVDHG